MSDGFDGLNPVLQHHIVNSLAWPGLRPLQEAAVAPLVSGSDALLLAPTAGGKTEAALFPLLTRRRAGACARSAAGGAGAAGRSGR